MMISHFISFPYSLSCMDVATAKFTERSDDALLASLGRDLNHSPKLWTSMIRDV